MTNQTSEVLQRVDEIEQRRQPSPTWSLGQCLKDNKWLCATLRTALKDTEWQPIETAPKDGTHIWSIDRNGDHCVVWWHYIISDHAYVWMDLSDREFEPTHWTPLPKPPAESPTTGTKE